MKAILADDEFGHAKLANEALARGQDAADCGDAAAARRWFERAGRLAPGDDTIRLCLAGACLNHDDSRAAELFAQVLERHDLQPAWTGLAIARLRLGEMAPAARALEEALRRFVVERRKEIAPIADRIAQAMDLPGWCGLQWPQAGPNATILLGVTAGRASGRKGKVEITLDGRPVTARQGRLPSGWQQAGSLGVSSNGEPLLGSPINIVALRRTEGCVWTVDDSTSGAALEGWAWYPANPTVNPTLTLRTLPKADFTPSRRIRSPDKTLTITPDDLTTANPGAAILGRPRHFQVPAAALAKLAGESGGAQIQVTGPDGVALAGSPLDPWIVRRAAAAAAMAIAVRFPAGPPASAGRRPVRPGVDVVMPVFGGGRVTLECIDTVLATLPRASRLVVVDDASPASDDVAGPNPGLGANLGLGPALDRLAARRRIHLIRHAANLGFPASANAGLRACAGRDVILLNSDTLVPPGWIERLRTAAYSAPPTDQQIGTVTPLSNAATLLSYPCTAEINPVPGLAETERLDRLAAKANGGVVIDIPTAVGFCMYIRRDCLDVVGALREDLFAQGYGEENDFCIRASQLGWRHVAAPGVFIAHLAGRSFGSARAHLLARNAPVLERLHPGYGDLIARHTLADPLAGARRRIDMARWQQARKPEFRRAGTRAALILITHFHGGGTERQLRVQIAAARAAGQRPIVLRPARLADGSTAVMLGDGEATDYPNLRFALPSELPALVRLLAAERPVAAQVHHLLGHDYSLLQVLAKLAVPYEVHIHDFAAFCPRVGLLGPDRRYCGEPEIAQCEACIADNGRKDGLDLPVAELRRVSAGLLGGAGRVVVPSHDTARRIQRHFPDTDPIVIEHGDDFAIADPPPIQPVRATGAGQQAICRVAAIGAIGLEKGYEVLLACARDAAWRDLPIEFIVVGHSIDDARLLATGRVFITGEYRPEEATELIRAQQASLALIPSIWPETWCFTLTEAWQAGLNAVCFDIGAPAERVRRTGRGIVLPLGLTARAINQQMIAATGLARDERA